MRLAILSRDKQLGNRGYIFFKDKDVFQQDRSSCRIRLYEYLERRIVPNTPTTQPAVVDFDWV